LTKDDLSKGDPNQKNTVINLYNSGLNSETISLELDIDEDLVREIIESENKRNKEMDKETENTNLSNYLINKFYLDAVINIDALIKESQIRTWNALKSKPELNIILKETQAILEQHAESKLQLVMLHIDLVGSTKMALTLPIDRLTMIIRAFTQEMTKIINLYGGYVLKYIGDAVLAFFVIEEGKTLDRSNTYNGLDTDASYDNNLSGLQFSNIISCAFTMIKAIQEGINPILNQYDYPELKVRVGIDFGEVAIVQYGIDVFEFEKETLKTPHLDLIGYTISVAVKMTSLAEPDHIVIGKKLFDELDETSKKSFKKLETSSEIWSYVNHMNNDLYDVFINK
jgi:class 3 adenylate cyclase